MKRLERAARDEREKVRDYFAARVLEQFGGRLQRPPLLIAIRRECIGWPGTVDPEEALEQAESLLDLAVESGAVVKNTEGRGAFGFDWYRTRPRR